MERECKFDDEWEDHSADGRDLYKAELQSQNASAAYSFVSRARSLSSSHPGSPDGDHGVDLQGPDTEAASMPTPANRARVGSEAPPALFSSVPVQDMEFTRERSASIHSSVSTNPSIVPDPDYHDDPSPAKKTFGILKERNVSLSGAPILPAQPETTPPRYPKTRTHTEMVEKELTFSERSLASLLAGSGRLVSGPAQSYFAMMRCATHDNVPRLVSTSFHSL